MSWLHQELPSFAYITADGDLILFDELQAEVLFGLQKRGLSVDHRPLTVTLQTIRGITEAYRVTSTDVIPTAEHFIDAITIELRKRRIILSRTMIHGILGEYLNQLRIHDIARVQYY